ncbi:hypothetical protein D3C80_1455860 [compost metagenome]
MRNSSAWPGRLLTTWLSSPPKKSSEVSPAVAMVGRKGWIMAPPTGASASASSSRSPAATLSVRQAPPDTVGLTINCSAPVAAKAASTTAGLAWSVQMVGGMSTPFSASLAR